MENKLKYIVDNYIFKNKYIFIVLFKETNVLLYS